MNARGRLWCSVITAAAAVVLLSLPLAFGQESPGNGEEEERALDIKADHLHYEKAQGVMHFWDNVIVGHKDARIYCDEAWYDEDDDTAKCLGHLKVTDPSTEIVGDLITADFTQEVIVIVNNVRLVHQKKEENGEAKPEEAAPNASAPNAEAAKATEPQPPGEGEPAASEEEEPETFRGYEKKLTTVTCDRVDYYYEQERAVARGSVVAKQEDKTVYADRAIYDEKNEIITLEGGNVRVETDEGDVFKCDGAIVDLDQDIIQANNITGIIHREKRKQEAAAAP
jgi:lipopolysaccharide assembly outer membrane protein LptD (OstA)